MIGDFMYVLVGKKKYALEDCCSFNSRFMGLMFVKDFDYCLRFLNCRSIHTFFMKTKIDVIMTDKDNNVLFIFRNLSPWKVILPKKGVYTTYEFPAGSIKNNIKKVMVKD